MQENIENSVIQSMRCFFLEEFTAERLQELVHGGYTILPLLMHENEVGAFNYIIQKSREFKAGEQLSGILFSQTPDKKLGWQARDTLQQNILHFAMQEYDNFVFLCSLFLVKKEYDSLAQLLIETDSDGDTVLHQCVAFNRLAVLDFIFLLVHESETIAQAVDKALGIKNTYKKLPVAMSFEPSVKNGDIRLFHDRIKTYQAIRSCALLLKENRQGIPRAWSNLLHDKNTVLHLLVRENKVDLIKDFLSRYHVNPTDEHLSKILFTENNHKKTVWDMKDSLHQNILHIAMNDITNFKKLCNILIDKKQHAILTRLLTETDSDGDTVLHQCVSFNRLAVLQYIFTLAKGNQKIAKAVNTALDHKNKKNTLPVDMPFDKYATQEKGDDKRLREAIHEFRLLQSRLLVAPQENFVNKKSGNIQSNKTFTESHKQLVPVDKNQEDNKQQDTKQSAQVYSYDSTQLHPKNQNSGQNNNITQIHSAPSQPTEMSTWHGKKVDVLFMAQKIQAFDYKDFLEKRKAGQSKAARAKSKIGFFNCKTHWTREGQITALQQAAQAVITACTQQNSLNKNKSITAFLSLFSKTKAITNRFYNRHTSCLYTNLDWIEKLAKQPNMQIEESDQAQWMFTIN